MSEQLSEQLGTTMEIEGGDTFDDDGFFLGNLQQTEDNPVPVELSIFIGKRRYYYTLTSSTLEEGADGG
jgi:hypothetical protein